MFFFCFLKKATKLSSQPAQYIKKTDKDYLKKKESILCKINEKKHVKKRKKKRKKTRRESYSVSKKKTKKLNFQPA